MDASELSWTVTLTTGCADHGCNGLLWRGIKVLGRKRISRRDWRGWVRRTGAAAGRSRGAKRGAKRGANRSELVWTVPDASTPKPLVSGRPANARGRLRTPWECMALQRRRRAGGRLGTPQDIEEVVSRQHPPGAKDKGGEKGPHLGAANVDGAFADHRLERSKDAEFHRRTSQ